jgi:hypothetical protein
MMPIIAGIALYVGKTFLTHLLFPKPLKRLIYANKFTLGVMDIGLTALAGKVIAAGSVTGMLVMISFGTCSFIYILLILGARKAKSVGGGLLCAYGRQ